jgi:hypothetical protein
MLNIRKIESKPDRTEITVDADLDADLAAGLNATALRRQMPELVNAHTIAADHAGALADLLKRVAKQHKLTPAVLRKYVAAAADTEKREKLAAQTEQMSLLLDLDD